MGRELCKSVNADEAVAYGAAIQAAILNGNNEQKLQQISLTDVIPLSLGIRLADGSLSVIIPRNTSPPADVTKSIYTTLLDYQTEMNIIIFEGEEKIADKNHRLGNFVIKNIPNKGRGVEKVDVRMKVVIEGFLHVSAVCTSSRLSGNITIDIRK